MNPRDESLTLSTRGVAIVARPHTKNKGENKNVNL
nr:MAG TPA: hypothetical protein [Caudoviricetes sp.]